MSGKKKEVVINKSNLNTFGFRVLTSGIDITQFKRNPILLWLHSRAWRGSKEEVLPIGTVENLRLEGDQLIGTPVFDESDDFAMKIKAKWESGVLRMASPGLDVIETSEDPKYLLPGQRRATITKSKLIELSIVDIGGNDEALVLSRNGAAIQLSSGEDYDEHFPEIKSKIDNSDKNMKTIALKLGLDEKATEAQILDKISVLNTNAAASVNLRKELDTLKLSGITRMVEKAISEKRITDDKKASFIELGKTSGAEILQDTLSLILPAGKITEQLSHSAGSSDVGYKKLSDVPEGKIVELRDNDRDNYVKLFKAEYGFAPIFEK